MRIKKQIFEISLSISIIFTNFHFLTTLSRKSNFFYNKYFELSNNDATQSNIDKSKTNFAWLEKYKNDKNFINCDFNAYISGRLIEKALIDQFFICAKIAFIRDFQQYISSFYGENLKFASTNYQLYDDPYYYDDMHDSFIKVQEIKTIKFNLDYFKLWTNELDLNTVFDRNKFDFISRTNYKDEFLNDIVSCFLSDEINGIYYVDEADKNNKDNEVNKKVKSKIKQLKVKMDYAKKQLLVFHRSLLQQTLSRNDEINELNLYLSQLVNDMKKLFDYTATKKEIHDKSYHEITHERYIVEAFKVWIGNYNIRDSLAYEDHYWFLCNIEAFFSYLTFHEKKYVDGENNNFKQAIADFLSKIKLNYTITTFEKAVVSYILATWNNKAIISSSAWTWENWDEWIFQNWDTIMKWLTIGIGTLATLYCAPFLPLNWMFATSNLIKIFSSKIENPSNLLPSFLLKISPSLVDLFANSPSLGDIFHPSSEKSITGGIIDNGLMNAILKDVTNIIEAKKFGVALNNFLKFISTKKYHDVATIKSLSYQQIFEMVENRFIEHDQSFLPNQMVSEDKINNIDKFDVENENRQEDVIFNRITDLFENQHPLVQKVGNECLLNSSDLPEKIVKWYPLGTKEIALTSLATTIYSKLNNNENVENNTISLEIIENCLYEYINVPIFNIENVSMEEILHIPWSYGIDKGVFDEIQKFNDWFERGNKSWYTHFYERFKNLYAKSYIDDAKTKIKKIFNTNNPIFLYHFNSNLWISSDHIIKPIYNVINKKFKCIGKGLIPFNWILPPILNELNKEQSYFTNNELIKIILSCFKIKDVNSKIISDEIEKIFHDVTLQYCVKNDEILYLKNSLPQSIIEKLQVNVDINGDDYEGYVKSSEIIRSTIEILKSSKDWNTISQLPHIFLRKIVEFYFEKFVEKNRRKKLDDKELKNTISQHINKIFGNKSLLCVNDTTEELQSIPMFLPSKIKMRLSDIFISDVPELVGLDKIAQAVIEILKIDKNFSNIVIDWNDKNLESIILENLKKIASKLGAKNQSNKDDLKINFSNNEKNKSTLIKELIKRFIAISKDIKIMFGYDSSLKKYIFYTTIKHLSPLIRERITIENEKNTNDEIAIAFDRVLEVIIEILKDDGYFCNSLPPKELETIIWSYYYKSLKKFICTQSNNNNKSSSNDINNIYMGINNKIKNYEKEEKINENQKNESVNGDKKQLKKIDDYRTEYVNGLLNNAKFIKVEEQIPMGEGMHDVYYFLCDYLPNEIKSKIGKTSIDQTMVFNEEDGMLHCRDSIKLHNLIKIIIDVLLVQLQKKLPIEENKSDDKLFDIVKEIVLNLIDNAKSNDRGEIYIIQNNNNKIDDFADAKLVINKFKISNNEIKNYEKNDHHNKNKETESYTKGDYAQADKVAKLFNKKNEIYHSKYSDWLRAAKKERILKEKFRKEKENKFVSVSLYIKKLLQNATIDNDIYEKYDTLCFTFDSLPNEVKEQIISSSNYINWRSLVYEIRKMLLNTINPPQETINSNTVEDCLYEVLGLEYSNFNNVQQCNLNTINKKIAERRKNINIKENKNDQENKIVLNKIQKIFKDANPIIEFCKRYPILNSHQACNNFVPYFSIKSLPSIVQEYLNTKPVCLSDMAKAIVGTFQSSNSKKYNNKKISDWLKNIRKSLWFTWFKTASLKYEIVQEQLDILYNPKYKIDNSIFCFVIQKLKNKLVFKVSDVDRTETYYRVKINTSNNNVDDDTDCIKFDDLVGQIISELISEGIIKQKNDVIIKKINDLCYQLLWFCEFDKQAKEKSKNFVAERDECGHKRYFTYFTLELDAISTEYLNQYSQGKKDFLDFLALKYDNNVDNFDNMGNNNIINDNF